MKKNILTLVSGLIVLVALAIWTRNEMSREISRERDLMREQVRKEIEEAPRKLIQDLLGAHGEEGKEKKARKTAGKETPKKSSSEEEKADPSEEGDSSKREKTTESEPKDLLGGILGVAGKVFKAVDRIGLDLTQMSEEDEMRVGRAMNKRFVAEHEVLSDPATEKRIRALSAPLLDQRTRKDIQYQIKVFKMDAPNAYSFAGGYVYVSSGYLKEFPSDAALTFVLGHEIGHVDLKHCIEKMQYLVIGNEIAGDLANLAATAYVTLRSSYSKEQEFSADEFGFRSARHAGVPAEEIIQCLRDLEAYQKGAQAGAGQEKSEKVESSLDEVFSTHPATSARVKRLEALSRRMEGSSELQGVRRP
jgi:hypothetical protein